MDNADIASPNGMDVGVFEDARDGPGGGEVGYGGGASPSLSAGQSSSISSHPASGFTHPTHDSMSSAPSSFSHRHVLSDDLSYGAASSKEVYNLNDEPPTRPRGSSRVSSYSSTHGRVGETSDSSYTRHDGVERHAQGLGQSRGYGTARAPPPGTLPMLPAQHPYAAGGAGSESASSSTYAPSHAPSGSVAVRIPGRIPSSAERKSSLPPPISPRTASLSQQQSSLPVSSGTDGYAGQASSVASGSTSTLHAPAYAESSRSRPNAGGVGGSNMNGHPTSAPAARTRSPRPPRVPSRHLLQSALDLAQQAVQMDQRHDIAGALAAYREAVSRLKAVMERVAADADRDGKRRRSGKSEEEGRTLQGIHDAYVARIQLLGTYETHDASSEPPPHSPGTGSGLMPSPSLDMSTPMDHAGTSTATLVPRRSPAAHHEVLDDPGGTSIGALMLGAPIDQVGSSVSSDSVAGQGSSMGTAGIAAVPEEGAAHSNSGTGIGLGLPTSPAKRIRNGDRPGTSGSGASTPSRHNRLRNQSMSKGLEDEIGLTEADGLVEYTSEPEEETLTSPIPPLSATSPVKKGHHSRTSSLGRLGQLISSSTSQGTISQRRKQPTSPRISISSKGESESGLPSSRSLAIPRRQRELERAEPIMAGVRSRSVSQPGGRRGEGYQAEMGDNVPPLPDVRKKTSFSNMTGATGYRGTSVRSDSLAPPSQVAHRSTSQSSLMRSDAGSIASRRTPRSANGSLISPVPPAQPTEVLHRPFHVLRILRSSMDADGPGAYLTGAIHIPSAVWNPSAYTKERTRLPGPRITAQDVKVRVIDQMLLHLEIIRHTGTLLLEGPREVNFAVAGVAPPRVGSKKCMDTGDEFVKVLEAFEEEMDGVYKSLLKGGVVLDAWKGKKGSNAMSWGSKMARSMDKMSGSSKGLETPDRYVDILAALCSALQTLDDHLYNFTGPCTPAYHALSEDTYRQLEIRMLRAADFVKVVVAPFVLDDFKQFFHRYLRAGMLYIET